MFTAIYGGLPTAEAVSTVSSGVQAVTQAAEQKGQDITAAIKAWNISRAMVSAFVAIHGSSIPQGEVLAIEQTLSMDVALPSGSHVRVVGTVDAAELREVGGSSQVWLIDHKTCSEPAPSRAQGLIFDTQSRLYRALWDSAHPAQPAFGITHNIIRKPTIRIKKSETYDDYFDRVDDWYKASMAEDPSAYPITRSHVRFNEPTLEGNAEVIETLEHAAHWATQPPSLFAFPRNRHGCMYRGRECPYRCLCDAAPDQWPVILRREKPWPFVSAGDPFDTAVKGPTALDANLIDLVLAGDDE